MSSSRILQPILGLGFPNRSCDALSSWIESPLGFHGFPTGLRLSVLLSSILLGIRMSSIH